MTHHPDDPHTPSAHPEQSPPTSPDGHADDESPTVSSEIIPEQAPGVPLWTFQEMRAMQPPEHPGHDDEAHEHPPADGHPEILEMLRTTDGSSEDHTQHLLPLPTPVGDEAEHAHGSFGEHLDHDGEHAAHVIPLQPYLDAAERSEAREADEAPLVSSETTTEPAHAAEAVLPASDPAGEPLAAAPFEHDPAEETPTLATPIVATVPPVVPGEPAAPAASFRPTTKLAARSRPVTMLAGNQASPFEPDFEPGSNLAEVPPTAPQGAVASVTPSSSDSGSDFTATPHALDDSGSLKGVSSSVNLGAHPHDDEQSPSLERLGDLLGDSGSPVREAVKRTKLKNKKQRRDPSGSSDVDLLHDHSDELGEEQIAALSSFMEAPSQADIASDVALVSAEQLDIGPAPAVRRRDDDEEPIEPEVDEDEAAVTLTEAADSRPVKAASGLLPWLGGGVGGALIGAAACAGLFLSGLVGSPAPVATKPQGASPPAVTLPELPVLPPAAPTMTPEMARARLHAGEFEEILAWLKQAGTAPERLAERGEATWLHYLQRQKRRGAELKADDPEVKEAERDLTTAKNANATFWLGHIKEALGKPDDARELYQQGLTSFPAQQRLFQSALDRLDSAGTAGSAKPAAGARRPLDVETALALAATALQDLTPAPEAPKAAADPAMPAAAPALTQTDEAGFPFWSAMKAARKEEYKTAIDSLKKARELHAVRRYDRLRKSQNPLSDPSEDIFLRSVDEQIAYLELRARLKDAELPSSSAEVAAAVDTLLEFKKKNEALVKTLADKLKEQKIEEPDLAKGIEQLLKDKKDADDQVGALKTLLEGEKLVGPDQKDAAVAVKDLLKKWKTTTTEYQDLEKKWVKVGERLTAAKADAEDPAKGIDQLAATRDELNKTVSEVVRKLIEAKYLTPGDKPAVAEALDKMLKDSSSPLVTAVARLVALAAALPGSTGETLVKAVDLTGRVAQSEARAAQAQLALKQSHPPQELLDDWLVLLSSPTAQPMLVVKRAAADAQAVSADPTPEVQAKALCVLGLTERQQGHYAEARGHLEAGLKHPGAAKAPWVAGVTKALAEISDPSVYYLPRAEAFAGGPRPAEALPVLDEAFKIFPKETLGKEYGKLLALRSELALRGGDLKQAATDAAAAVEAGATAEGNLALARVAEAKGDWTKAETGYREALKTLPAGDRSLNRARLGLARTLLHLSWSAPKPEQNTQRLDRLTPLETMIVLASTGLLAAADPAPVAGPAAEEALQLADQAIKDGDNEGYLVKARALADKGLWTDALRTYTEGLRKLIKPQYAAGLTDLIENHPAFRVPDLVKLDPGSAERFFASGLEFYNARQFTEAEKDFAKALEYFQGDARYFYFLGLARLPQAGKQDDAYEAFRKGLLLELQKKPDSVIVNAALERVQGPARQALNSIRP